MSGRGGYNLMVSLIIVELGHVLCSNRSIGVAENQIQLVRHHLLNNKNNCHEHFDWMRVLVPAVGDVWRWGKETKLTFNRGDYRREYQKPVCTGTTSNSLFWTVSMMPSIFKAHAVLMSLNVSVNPLRIWKWNAGASIRRRILDGLPVNTRIN